MRVSTLRLQSTAGGHPPQHSQSATAVSSGKAVAQRAPECIYCWDAAPTLVCMPCGHLCTDLRRRSVHCICDGPTAMPVLAGSRSQELGQTKCSRWQRPRPSWSGQEGNSTRSECCRCSQRNHPPYPTRPTSCDPPHFSFHHYFVDPVCVHSWYLNCDPDCVLPGHIPKQSTVMSKSYRC
jgi:hypothetical protein